jgi:hypothetical protein
MDVNDLYDHEIARIGPVWQGLMREFSRRANTRANLEELQKRAAAEFLRIGLVVEVNTAPCMIANPVTMRTGPPEVVIIGRAPGIDHTEQGFGMFDHELKRHEVLTARDRGEDFMGQRDKPSR